MSPLAAALPHRPHHLPPPVPTRKADSMTTATAEKNERRWTLVHEARPVTLNAERAAHWRHHRQLTAEWRQAFAWLARAHHLPAMQRIAVTATPVLSDRRAQDVGACFPSVKAAVDGLVDAGVIPDDTPAHVVRLTFETPVLGARVNSLRLLVEELPEGIAA